MRGLRAIAGIGLLVAASSCGAGYHNYRTLNIQELPFEDVWGMCVDAVETGFDLDRAQFDRGARKLVTKWKVGNAVLFRRGDRTRLHLEVETHGPRDFNIRFYVEQEQNKNMSHSFHPREEDWSSAGQDGLAEDLLAQHLRSRVATRKGLSAPSVQGLDHEEPLRGVKRR